MKVDLHVVSWQRPKMTRLVLETIKLNTKPENYRIVVYDNGSDAETQKMLFEMQDTIPISDLLLMSKNNGLEPARNYMLYQHTYSPYFICVDNDCLPEPMVDGRDWVERLVELMDTNPEYGAIACRTQVMIGTGNIFEETDVNGSPITDFPWPGGSLRIMRTGATRDAGGWRDTMAGRGGEERFICGKLQEAGYKTGFATDIRTLHLFGTRGKNGTDRWGYDSEWLPKKTGHSDIYHPALVNGDDFDEVEKFSGTELAKEYFENA